MPRKDLTVEILKEIRDDARETRRELCARIDAVGARVGGLADRIDGVATRVVVGESRTATAITALHETVRDIASMLRAEHDLRPRVERCEKDIADIQHQLKSG